MQIEQQQAPILPPADPVIFRVVYRKKYPFHEGSHEAEFESEEQAQEFLSKASSGCIWWYLYAGDRLIDVDDPDM